MSEEGLTLTVDENQVSGVYVSADPAVAYSGLSPTAISSGRLGVAAGAVASGSVDVGATVYVYSDPTTYWASMYPQTKVGIDLLEDRDVKFEPKQTRLTKVIITGRKKGEFITDFTDE